MQNKWLWLCRECLKTGWAETEESATVRREIHGELSHGIDNRRLVRHLGGTLSDYKEVAKEANS